MNVNHLAEVDPVLRTSEQVLARKGEGAPTNSEDLLPIDELEEVADGNDEVSQALLSTAGQMDAYVRGNTVADDELEDSAARPPVPARRSSRRWRQRTPAWNPLRRSPEDQQGGRKRKKRGRGLAQVTPFSSGAFLMATVRPFTAWVPPAAIVELPRSPTTSSTAARPAPRRVGTSFFT